ncbi:hypothetical protein [Roseomonas chloroacetimidivorans]|uniref:hypothetical protein n=1 Tax=Roseomonas chloroacetimidivorans TaxID=1766656 RepID=UPI003C7658E8
MITNQPNDVERLRRERDGARRDYERIAEAAANLLGRMHAMVASGELKTLPEMEAMEIALAASHEDSP